MLYLSAAIALGRTSGAYKQGGDPGTRLLLGVVQTALALVLSPPLLIAVIVAGVHSAADWCTLRIMSAIRGDERFLYRPMWSRFELPGNDSRALREALRR